MLFHELFKFNCDKFSGQAQNNKLISDKMEMKSNPLQKTE